MGKATELRKAPAPPAVNRTRGVAMGMLQDPVCGIPVIGATDRDFGLVAYIGGWKFFFDSIQCKQNFDKKAGTLCG